jgi:hypothetical protein
MSTIVSNEPSATLLKARLLTERPPVPPQAFRLHFRKEEEVLYPALTRQIGTEAAGHLARDHDDLKDALNDLESLSSTDIGFQETAAYVAHVSVHLLAALSHVCVAYVSAGWL